MDLYSLGNEAATQGAQSALSGADATLRLVEQVNARLYSTYTSVSQSSFNTGQSIIKSTVDSVSQYVTQMRSGAVQLVSSIIGGIGMIRGAIVSGFVSAAGASSSMVATVAQRIVGFIAGLAPQLITGFSGIVGTLSTLVSTVGGAISGTMNAARMGLSALLSPISAFLSLRPVGMLIVTAVGMVATVAAGIITRMSGFAMAARSFMAVGGIATSAFQFAGSVLTNAATLIRSGIGTVSSVARTAFSTLGAWAKSAWAWVQGIAQSVGSFVSSSAGSIVSAISSLAATALKAGIALAQVAGAGTLLAAFGGAVYAATNAAMEFAKSARDLSGITGFSLGKSAGLLDRLGIQGISASSIQGAYSSQSPFAADLKARAFGLSGGPDSAGFLASFSRQFQRLNSGGISEHAMAQAMVKSLGLDSSFVRAAQTSPATQQANATYQRTIDANLGLSPSTLAGYAEAVPAMLQRIGYGAQKALLFLANAVLPIVEDVLSTVTKTIGENAGGIAGFVQNSVRFMFVRVGPMFVEGVTTIITMVSSAVTNLVAWGTWLSTEFPALLGRLAQGTADTLRNFAAGFNTFSQNFLRGASQFLSQAGLLVATFVHRMGNGIADQLDSFGHYIQSVASDQNNPMKVLALAIAGGLDAVLNAARSWSIGITNIVVSASNFIYDHLQILANQLGITGHITPQQANMMATGGAGPSDLRGGVQNAFSNLPKVADGVLTASNAFRANANDMASRIYGNMNDLASSIYSNGMDATNAVTGVANRVGNAIASPDGKYNVGSNFGNGVANFVKPAVDALSRIEPGIRDFATAAQAYKQSLGTEQERNSRFEKLQERTNELLEQGNRTSNAIKENFLKNGSFGSSTDAVAGVILSEYASQSAAALRRRA